MPRLPRRRRRRSTPATRFLIRAGLVVVGIGLLLGVFATVRLLLIARDLREARHLIDTASAEVRQTEIAAANDHLDQAQRILADANGDLFGSVELDLVSWAPIVSQNLHALRDSVSKALSMVGSAGRVLDAVSPLVSDGGTLEVPMQNGQVPLDALAATSTEVQAMVANLPRGGQRPGGPLFGPVRELQDVVYDQAEQQRNRLDVLSRGLRLLSDMAGESGDRRYLLAFANTAEMRGTGGMILSYGVLESTQGRFTFTTHGGIDDLFLRTPPDPSLVPIRDDEAERWPGLEPTRLWRNANLVPDFTVVGPRLATMYELASGLPISGVVQIDVQGLAAIMRAIGPVEVPDVGTLDADNVTDYVLNQIYSVFPEDENNQRREVLGEVADAVFERLTTDNLASLRTLAEALAEAANQRHIILYADTADASSAAEQLGVNGLLPPPNAADGMLFTLQNMGRDKLDYYIDTDVQVTGTRPAGEFSDMEVTISVTNNAPAGVTTPSYVFGTAADRGAPAGTYVGVGSFYVPSSSLLTGSSGDSTTEPVLTTENGRTVVGFDVQVPPGATATVTLQVKLAPRPPGQYVLVLAPAPRIRPTTWAVDIDDGDGHVARRDGPLLTPEGVAAGAG